MRNAVDDSWIPIELLVSADLPSKDLVEYNERLRTEVFELKGYVASINAELAKLQSLHSTCSQDSVQPEQQPSELLGDRGQADSQHGFVKSLPIPPLENSYAAGNAPSWAFDMSLIFPLFTAYQRRIEELEDASESQRHQIEALLKRADEIAKDSEGLQKLAANTYTQQYWPYEKQENTSDDNSIRRGELPPKLEEVDLMTKALSLSEQQTESYRKQNEILKGQVLDVEASLLCLMGHAKNYKKQLFAAANGQKEALEHVGVMHREVVRLRSIVISYEQVASNAKIMNDKVEHQIQVMKSESKRYKTLFSKLSKNRGAQQDIATLQHSTLPTAAAVDVSAYEDNSNSNNGKNANRAAETRKATVSTQTNVEFSNSLGKPQQSEAMMEVEEDYRYGPTEPNASIISLRRSKRRRSKYFPCNFMNISKHRNKWHACRLNVSRRQSKPMEDIGACSPACTATEEDAIATPTDEDAYKHYPMIGVKLYSDKSSLSEKGKLFEVANRKITSLKKRIEKQKRWARKEATEAKGLEKHLWGCDALGSQIWEDSRGRRLYSLEDASSAPHKRNKRLCQHAPDRWGRLYLRYRKYSKSELILKVIQKSEKLKEVEKSKKTLKRVVASIVRTQD